MSSNSRRNFIEELVASFPDGAATAVTLPRPRTENPPLNNNRDHVIEPPSRDEYRGGKAIVELPSTLDIGTVFVRKIEVLRGFEGFEPNSPTSGGSDQGTNVIGEDAVGPTPGALFPNGSLGVGDPKGLYESPDNPLVATSGLALGAAPRAVHNLLANIPIGENDQIRLTIFNNSGGDLNDQKILTTYDTGLYAGDYSLQS